MVVVTITQWLYFAFLKLLQWFGLELGLLSVILYEQFEQDWNLRLQSLIAIGG